MNILGVSGLENSVAFKQAHWPRLESRDYRISQGHDSAAALLVDGRLVAAAAQERFSRKKHAGEFPLDAIRYCLAEARIKIGDIDEIARGFDYSPYRQLYSIDTTSAKLFDQVFSPEAFVRQVCRYLPELPAERVYHVGHHLAHAASAALTSGWDECLVIVNDAMGEVQSLTAYHFAGGKFKKLRELSSYCLGRRRGAELHSQRPIDRVWALR
jgi:carbamoyltransferase